jgi:hypothetical protein
MQWLALNTTLRELLPCGTTNESKWSAIVDACRDIQNVFLKETRLLSGFAENGQTSYISAFVHDYGSQYGDLEMALNMIQGAAYVTSIKFSNFALDLRHLTRLVQGLPKLERLELLYCNKYDVEMGVSNLPSEDARHLPDALAAASPMLKKFWIRSSKLTGTLPRTYGSWQHMESILLRDNSLTGIIPQVR